MKLKLKLKLNIDTLIKAIALPTFFMMIVTSRGFTQVKTILLFLLTLVCFIDIVLGNSSIRRDRFKYVVGFIIFSFVSLVWGILLGYPFDVRKDYSLIQYFFFTPIIVLIISSTFNNRQDRADVIFRLLKYVTLFVVFMDVWKILSMRHILPDIDIFGLFFVASNVAIEGELSLRVANEASLLYLMPFYVVMLFLEKDKHSRRIARMIIIIGIVYSLLSGRKMLILVIAASLLFMIFYDIIKKGKTKKLFYLLLLLIFLLIVINRISSVLKMDNILDLAQQTLSAGLSSKAGGVIARAKEARVLFDLWLQSPLWGNGLNSYSTEMVVTPKQKWSYEVVYNAFLAQTGIMGVAILGACIIYIIRKLKFNYRHFNRPVHLAAMIAFISFIICGASNPLAYMPWPWIVTLVAVDNYNFGRFSDMED